MNMQNVDGYEVAVSESGECFQCENGEPTEALAVSIGPLTHRVGFCDGCADDAL